MKHNLTTTVLFLLLVAALLGCGYFYMHSESAMETQRKNDATTFTLAAIKAITNGWDADELSKRAHPLLTEGLAKSGKNMDSVFGALKQLGPLKNDSTCSFVQFASVTTGSERFATATYACKMELENSGASIVVDVRQDNMRGPWQIVNFNVSSPLFSAKPDDKKDNQPDEPRSDKKGGGKHDKK